jgi:nitronate monooxygenase
MRTRFCDRLDLELPLVQAPMAGVSTAALAGAVSRAGALGSIAVGAMSPATANDAVGEALSTSSGMLNVNVFTHATPRRDQQRELSWLCSLAPLFSEFGAEPPAGLNEIYRTFDDDPELLDVLMAHRPPVVSFHFGLPRASSLLALKDYGACLMATATSVKEARRLEAAGIDVIIAQGFEAGGHRGTFADEPDECLSTFTLLPRLVAAVAVPVLAAGGIMSGAGMAAALALGASGAQLGTVFVDCPESAAGAAYRQALRIDGRRTAMTAVFSGRRARGLVNRFMLDLGGREREVPDYPVAYDAAKQLAAAAMAGGSNEFTAMWAGQGPMRDAPLPAAELVGTLAEELATCPP